MENKLSHRIFAFLLAVLMLLSTSGFKMDIHFCQDQFSGISFLGKATCCQDKISPPLCRQQVEKACHDNSFKEVKPDSNNCCHNESIVIEKSDLNATVSPLAAKQHIQLEFVAAFAAIQVLNHNFETSVQTYEQYKPPLPDRDFQVLYQTFRI